MKRSSTRLVSLLLGLALAAAACGGDTAEPESTEPPATTTTAAAPEDPATTQASPTTTEAEAPTTTAATTTEPIEEATPEEPMEPTQVAYLSASSANTWLAASREAMEKLAAENNIEIVEFDAQFDPALQQQQFQDAITAGRYDGIILVAIAGAAAIPDILDALDAGIEVVALNQVVGDDLVTAEPQVEGMAAAVFEPPYHRGTRLGELTVAACAGIDPCNVVYFYGIRGIPLDEAVRGGWDESVAGSTVTVAAEAEGLYLGPDVALDAMQDILVTESDIDVVVGADQSMQGAEIALTDAGREGIRIIGFGGSSYAVEAITDGRWWGGLYGAPYTEGRLAMEAMVQALAGIDMGGVDTSLNIPNRGLMTQDNIDEFPGEWDG
ncbi:sugar ABC transporter substrate-binding protein [Candidatus Spongiisocius sp.]|uniref:sugar ABC transporter substrate-binding protein n=1 Tax=Candidatus Spongiisocius sp. TaxID=3101273 RepID=UPI003B5BF5E2